MLAVLALSLPLSGNPLAPPVPQRHAILPAQIVIRDPRMPLVGRRARRREAALARKA